MKTTLIISKENCRTERSIAKWLDSQVSGEARYYDSSNIVCVEEHENAWHVQVDDEFISIQ